MAATQTTALLVLGLLSLQCCADPSSCPTRDQAEEAIDNDVHEVQLVQLARLAQGLSAAGTQHAAVESNTSQHAAVEGNTSQEGAAKEAALLPPPGGWWGLPGCNCIGITSPGRTTAMLDGHPTDYPASAGAKCNFWDKGNDPACKGKNQPAYCNQMWCYVDGCACNLSAVPKISSYFPSATFQGATLYYSYETCNATDNWTSTHHKDACVNQKSKANCVALPKCAWTGTACVGKELQDAGACESPAPADIIGSKECRCVGISNLTGTVQAHINNKLYDYPADTGSHCEAWDNGLHPSCSGAPQPYWCEQHWCYVDPCSCHLDVVPKRITYVSGAKFQGRPLFYSYRTCGEVDTYSSEENTAACPTRPSRFQCEQSTNCTWVGAKGCVHKDILSVCGEEGLEAAETSAQKSAGELRGVAPAVALVIGLALWS